MASWAGVRCWLDRPTASRSVGQAPRRPLDIRIAGDHQHPAMKVGQLRASGMVQIKPRLPHCGKLCPSDPSARQVWAAVPWAEAVRALALYDPNPDRPPHAYVSPQPGWQRRLRRHNDAAEGRQNWPIHSERHNGQSRMLWLVSEAYRS
jgi:hypothetical protein